MAEESLGHARLDLSVGMTEFRRNINEGQRLSGGMGDSLDALAAVANIAEKALGDVKMSGVAAVESGRIADRIEASTGKVGRAAMEASHHLEKVKLGAEQAAETTASGDVIDGKLRQIDRQANETRRSLDRVRLAGGRNGAGVGPFGSGFGRVGLLGAAVGAGVLTGPAIAPAAAGLLASIPTLGAAGVGVLGTLALAFQGVGKAIGGDLKAFNKLQPAQQQFVQTIRSMIPWLDRLKQIAGAGLFPGLTHGLQAAFSPGTVGEITKAVSEFAAAIGKAGEQWGRYFGSRQFAQIFGPLMAAGARNLGLISDAALRLFDALGVIGRAAIPLTSWLTQLADRGARLVDTWTNAKSASGGLSRGLNEARESLRLVGGLVASLGRTVGALGVALYPVSKVAVKDLTDGLNALAAMIRRNQDTIREIVGGALAALVSTVRTATPIVGALARGLNSVAHSIGGWKTAFELVIGGFLASKFVGLAKSIDKTLIALRLVGPTAATTAAETDTALASIGTTAAATSTKVGLLLTRLRALGALGVITVGVELIFHAKGINEWLREHVPGLAKIQDYEDKHNPVAHALNNLAPDVGVNPPPQLVPGVAAGEGQHAALRTNHLHKVAAAAAASATTAATSTTTDDPGVFGTPPPFDKNVPAAKKPKQPPLLPRLASHALDFASANASKASQLGNVGGTAKRYLDNELADLQTAAKLIRDKYDGAVGKVRTQLFHSLTGVQNKIRTVRTQIKNAITQDRLAQIQFAVDLAQLAMASSKEGSAAYKQAERHEESLLRQEIKYLDKRVKNKKLSLAKRSEALQSELSARQQLSSLLGQSATAAANVDQQQFLSTFAEITHSFAPNSFPQPPSSAKTNTQLHELVTETRLSNQHLKELKAQGAFPSTGLQLATAEAAYG